MRNVRIAYAGTAAVLPFAATATWDTYETVDVPMTLAAESTISLVFNGGKGSGGFLNLDRLVLTKKP